MRHGEGGHDLENIHEGGSQSLHAAPLPGLAPQHGWQQQREQKQDVIVTGPDVPDAFAQKYQELPARAHHANFKLLRAVAGSDNGSSGFGLAFSPRHAPMAPVDVAAKTA